MPVALMLLLAVIVASAQALSLESECVFEISNGHSMHFGVDVAVRCPIMNVDMDMDGTASTRTTSSCSAGAMVDLMVSKHWSWRVDKDQWLSMVAVAYVDLHEDEEGSTVYVGLHCPCSASSDEGGVVVSASLPFHKAYEPATEGAVREETFRTVLVADLATNVMCDPVAEGADLVPTVPVGNLNHLPYVMVLNTIAYVGSFLYLFKHVK
jgi:hypothetical protein